MHEHAGLFCKSVKHWNNAKFTESKKNINGPKLLGAGQSRRWGSSPMGLARSDLEEAGMGLLGCGLTHGPAGPRGAGPHGRRELGLRVERTQSTGLGRALVVLLLEAEDAGGDGHGRTWRRGW